MDSARKFAEALEKGFNSPGVKRRIEELKRPAYAIGDGTAVALGDHVRIPENVGGRRAGEWGVVVMVDDEGLGIRFQQKFAGITREFFEWADLRGASATAISRKGKRAFALPPSAT
ncbi:hypothetical protein G6L37_07115 [Agrobacterium rubi]|nr:hypothetical protein [Agrobacterium rubi]NTF25136.1 hypothetical protein [Agrobacterium rubi]